MHRFELTLDAVKRLIFENYNRNLDSDSKLLDKDYKIWYNYDKQTISLERKTNDKTSN